MRTKVPPTKNLVLQELSKHPLFADLPPVYGQALAEGAQQLSFDAGQVIFREGEEASRFFLVLDGSVVLEAFSLQYGSLPVQTLEGGDVFGWSVLVPPHRWRLDARAAEPTTVLALDGARLREACEKDPSLGYALLQRFAMLLEQRLQAVRQQLIERQARSW